jgi:hypothetical protein
MLKYLFSDILTPKAWRKEIDQQQRYSLDLYVCCIRECCDITFKFNKEDRKQLVLLLFLFVAVS